jgi:hypothetical protein
MNNDNSTNSFFEQSIIDANIKGLESIVSTLLDYQFEFYLIVKSKYISVLEEENQQAIAPLLNLNFTRIDFTNSEESYSFMFAGEDFLYFVTDFRDTSSNKKIKIAFPAFAIQSVVTVAKGLDITVFTSSSLKVAHNIAEVQNYTFSDKTKNQILEESNLDISFDSDFEEVDFFQFDYEDIKKEEEKQNEVSENLKIASKNSLSILVKNNKDIFKIKNSNNNK